MPAADIIARLRLRSAKTGGAETVTGPEQGAGGHDAEAVSNPARGDGGKAEVFVLGESLPSVPAKLVARVRKGEYVDMADLLRDNIEVDRRRTAQGGDMQPATKLQRREIPDVSSWAQCFCSYIGIVVEESPERTKQLLAYLATVLREARRCGGEGWRSYDAMFRQLAATDATMDWSRLNPSLYATTFLARQGGGGKSCHLCMDVDHSAEECALAPLLPRPTKMLTDGKEEKSGGAPGPKPGAAVRDPRGRRWSDQPCYLWNEGRCTFPYCRYRHICTRCRGEHRAVQCSSQLRSAPVQLQPGSSGPPGWGPPGRN